MAKKILCRVGGISYIASEACAPSAGHLISIRIQLRMHQINSVISISLSSYQQDSSLGKWAATIRLHVELLAEIFNLGRAAGHAATNVE